MRATVWEAAVAAPWELTEVELPVLAIEEAGLVLPGLRVADRAGARLFDGDDLRFEPRFGGGPLVARAERKEARAFGVVNAAFHLSRALTWASSLLDQPLPPVVALIGVHSKQRPRWGGGHYRLPAHRYTDLPEHSLPASSGEIHLGTGAAYLPWGHHRYFDAPSHNAAILYHEFGHHLTCHTADFRLNRLLPLDAQSNRKVPLDEGTCDYLAAVLLSTPDIFGWHRGRVPLSHPKRRCLDPAWTMALFHGGSANDPHDDGTVWGSALWSARTAVEAYGLPGSDFDAVVVDALVRIGESYLDLPRPQGLRRRRRFSMALQAILEADQARGARMATVIEDAFAAHGIVVGMANRELRDRSRRSTLLESNGTRAFSATTGA